MLTRDGLEWEYGFWVAERHRNGSHHLHGLAAFSGQATDKATLKTGKAYRFYKEDWYRRHGIARVERIRSSGAVTAYCLKYVLKSNPSEWRIVESGGMREVQ